MPGARRCTDRVTQASALSVASWYHQSHAPIATPRCMGDPSPPVGRCPMSCRRRGVVADQRQLTPTVTAQADTGHTFATVRSARLTELIGADQADTLQSSRRWLPLITAVDHALQRGWRLDDILGAAVIPDDGPWMQRWSGASRCWPTRDPPTSRASRFLSPRRQTRAQHRAAVGDQTADRGGPDHTGAAVGSPGQPARPTTPPTAGLAWPWRSSCRESMIKDTMSPRSLEP